MQLDVAPEERAPRVKDAAPPQAVVATLLPEPLAARLAAACASHRFADLADAHAAQLAQRADLLCVDPAMVADEPAMRAQVVALTGSGTPCVFYTRPSVAALRSVVALQSSVAPVMLVLHEVDDGRATLAGLLGLATRNRLAMELTGALASLLAPVPMAVRQALLVVAREPQRFFDGTDVARGAGISRRHVDRILSATGLAPSKDWVIASRSFHAVRLLAGSERTVSEIAADLAYADEKGLRRHTAAVWSLTPREAAQLDPAALLGQVIRFVGRRAD